MFFESKFKRACSKMLVAAMLVGSAVMPVCAQDTAKETKSVEVSAEATTVSSVEVTTTSQVSFTVGKKVYVKDGAKVEMDAAPMLKDNKTVLPVKYVGEALNADVKFDNATKTLTIKAADGTVATVKVGEAVAKVEGTKVELGAKAFIEGGRTYVPVAALAELVGAEVKWDNTTKTATFIG